MDLVTLFTFTIAYAIAVLVPGPGVAAVVARALGGGFASAFPMVLGILIGDLLYLVVAVFGLAALAMHFSAVFIVVRWAGALYLLYIAYKFWTARPDAETVRARAGEHWSRTLLAGVALTLGNPKTIVFYLALLPTVVPLDQMTALAFAELTAIVIVVLLAIGCGYAFLAAAARDVFRSPVALGRLNKTAAAIMTAAAAAVVWR
ncbi:LysE family translocator [Arsenicitalea aurantiaca]|uniref:LysE family translocator n=1 Tax=Arsenicitalea aurantiaca TaxID=1783274 RepID=A0A433XM27_9HYPH|nr:LysE family translocator [Arsenicitalea aurantiaca]RUT35064.1 LysE family translocator [Arsenicitalea aurantiaca]